MSSDANHDSTEEFEKALEECPEVRYTLRLFVAGMTPKSQRAIEAVKELCDTELQGRIDLEIVDIYQQPELVKDEQVLAAPTLIKKLPLPLRRIIGDMSDKERLIVGLDLRPKCD